MPRNIEQTRSYLLDRIDNVLDLGPLARQFVSREDRRSLRAMRNLVQQDDGTFLAKYGEFLDNEPMRDDPEGADLHGAINHPGWLPGPMPPGTYHWGGVVPTDADPNMSGFYFADFHGDHVLMNPREANERRLDPDQVRWYNNALDLPPQKKGGAT